MFNKIKELIENFLYMKKYNTINEIKLLREDIATIVQASLERKDNIDTLLRTYMDNQSEIKDVLEDIYHNTNYCNGELSDIIDKLKSIENTVSQPKVIKRKTKKSEEKNT